MMRRYFVIALLLANMLGMVHADLTNLCTDLFDPSGILQSGNAHFAAFASFTNTTMIWVSIEIVIAVLSLLAIMYGIGIAFSLQRVITFVKTEYMESILSLAIIVILAGGMTAVAGGVGFITNLGAAVVQASGAGGSNYGVNHSAPGGNINNINQLYMSVCNNYFNAAISEFDVMGGLTVAGFGLGLASSITISLMPSGMGISTSLGGMFVSFYQLLSFVSPLVSGAATVEIGLIFIMAVIYYLFPLFLYSGVLLRSFPWTRSAGGTLLALFIGFYVFFPALIYPFTTINYQCLITGGCSGIPGVLGLPTTPSAYMSTTNPLTISSAVTSAFSGSGFLDMLDYWTFSIIDSSFQIFGVVVSFIISYSILEGFADLLGAPSLQAKNLLRNVI